MKIFQVTSTGFGKELFAAETVEGAIEKFREHVAHCDKLNGSESADCDTVIVSVRRLGQLINHKP